MPPLLSYVSVEMIDYFATTSCWVPFFSEWTGEVSTTFLREAYDGFRLWFLPTALRLAMREMDLSFVLGSPSNYQELLRLLNVIDQVD